MYDKFGDMDSAEEINKKAAELKEANDQNGLNNLCKENGIDVEEAEDYMDGMTEELVTPIMAAAGKLKVEEEDLELAGIVKEWKEVVLQMCMDDPKMCVAVRRKKKKLAECMAMLIAFAFENKVQISKKIVDITKVKHNGSVEKMRSPLYMGIPTTSEVRQLAREYYER